LEHPNLVFFHHFPPLSTIFPPFSHHFSTIFRQGKAPPRAKASATKAKATKPVAKAAATAETTKAVPEKAKKAKRLGRWFIDI
jgi:hypothetical protein